jgi:hypothetical protein
VAALGLAYVTRLGWQHVSDEVSALVHYEDDLSYRGETLLVLRVQDYTNAQWLDVRTNQVGARQAAPLPMPQLSPDPDSVQVGRLQVVAADWVRAEVLRRYQTPTGQTLTFALPQFYRRQGRSEDWVRTGVPDSYWGAWQDWRSPHLFVRHSERDQALVERIGPRLEALLAEAGGLWRDSYGYSDDVPPAKLFFSGFIGSLEYDPLANIRVRVEFGSAASGEALPTDYFLSVPSPQLAGEPADTAAEQYLTEYLAVRLIASMADAATARPEDADRLTAQAIARLGLAQADPGFTAAAERHRGSEGELVRLVDAAAPPEPTPTIAPPVIGSSLVTRLNPPAKLLVYKVQPGDTLLGIANAYAVSLESIARLNGITNPDLIQAGTDLLIPLATTPTSN